MKFGFLAIQAGLELFFTQHGQHFAQSIDLEPHLRGQHRSRITDRLLHERGIVARQHSPDQAHAQAKRSRPDRRKKERRSKLCEPVFEKSNEVHKTPHLLIGEPRKILN